MGAMRLKSRYIIKPEKPTTKCIIPLSELDQVSVITHSSVLYFYENPKQIDTTTTIMNTLKESLSRALVPFYPLAGRLSYIGEGRFALDCNAKGAELVEVESTLKIADFGDFYSATQTFRDLLIHIDYYQKYVQEIPLLAVQVTRFACGGLCLGMSMSHMVADGRSAFLFFKEWAKLALGEPLDGPPHLDRRVLLAQDPPTRFEDGDFNYFRELRLMEGENWGKQVPSTFVVLTMGMIAKLKKAANMNNEQQQQRPFSRFEVVAAHVWRCACKARELKKQDTTTFMTVVSAHQRVNPPLPSSFFGNVVIDVDSSSNVGELISKPLSFACGKVREAIEKVNNEHILDTIEFLKTQERLGKYQYVDDRGIMEGPAYGDNNITVMSWLNLPVGGLDFGWGREIHMAPPIVQACNGDFHLSPYKKDGSIVIALCFQAKDKFVDILTSPFLSY